MSSSPRPSTGPTVAQLKADIDSGRTGDKVASPDPGLSALGTDDEAAGRPNSPERIALARKLEARPNLGESEAPRVLRAKWLTPAVMIGVIVLVAVLVVAVYLGRR